LSDHYVRYCDWNFEKSIVRPDENGWWRWYIAARKEARPKCYDMVEDQVAAINDLTVKNQQLQAAASGESMDERASVFEMGPADSRAFGRALAGQAGPVNWKTVLRGASRAYGLKASGPAHISET
jgi:hypothetical protein